MLFAGLDVLVYSLLCLEAFVAVVALEGTLCCVAHLMLLQPCGGDKSL